MILVTGVSGFIGKHLLKSLIEKYGASNILALTSKPISDCNYLIHENYTFEKNYFTKNNYESIETIVHAGAFTPKNGKDANNIKLSNSNIQNTEKLITADFPSLKKIIFLSTLDVYNNENVISEESLEKPTSLYGLSKLYCEKMIEKYGDEKKIKTQILRIGHVYGPGEENYQKIIPVSMKNILTNKKISIFGEGLELRAFIYINDVVTAIINCIELDRDIGIVNIVSENSISIKKLVDKIIKLSDTSIEIELINSTFESRNFIFNNEKLKKYLLKNETDLDDGLRIEYNYMKNLS